MVYLSIGFFNFFEFSFVKKLVLKVYNSLIDFLVFVCYNIVKWGSIIIIIVGYNIGRLYKAIEGVLSGFILGRIFIWVKH